MNPLTQLKARWHSISPREQRLLLGALALVVGALLWWVALAPALSALRTAPAQQRLLDAQLQKMLSLQARAKAMQAQNRLSSEEARRLLETSVKPFGAGTQLSVIGERASLSLKGVSPDALAQWLTQVRINARTVPQEARLQRNPTGNWDATLVLSLSPS